MLEIASRLRRVRRAAERVAARARFALLGQRHSFNRDPLSRDQVRQFEDEGYLLVSGLVSDTIAAAAAAAMWRCLGVLPDASDTWKGVDRRPRMLKEPDLVACYTDDTLAAAAQLAGDDVASLFPPSAAYTINAFPTTGEWRWREPHIDHATEAARHRTSPRPFRIAAMTYLSDVEPHGGGTMVWPGSHRSMEALARSDPRKYARMSSLNAAVDTMELGCPVELTPGRGDVLFYPYLMVHASSTNLNDAVRLAINKKW